MKRRTELAEIDADFRREIKKIPIVLKAVGIGSYFLSQKKNPGDIDYCLVLDREFQEDDEELKKLSDLVESMPNKHEINIFLQDSTRNRIDIVDLFFIFHRGERLKDILVDREYLKSYRWKGV